MLDLWQKKRRKEFVELVTKVEEWGFDTVWVLDEELYKDCYVHLALAALNTTKVRLGTAVTNPVTRHPAITAEAIGTIDELSNGRAILGMGLGGSVRKMLQLESSLSRLREATAIIRRLWAGEKISFEGKHYRLKDAKLDFETRRDIPIFTSGSGPKSLKTAGEIADGAIIHVGVSQGVLKFAFKEIGKGLIKVGKSFKDFYTVCWTPTSISEDVEAAKEDVKPFSAWLMANAPSLGRIEKIDEEDLRKLRGAYHRTNERFKAGGKSRVSELVTDDMIDKFSMAGTVEDCIKKIKRIAREGVDQLAIIPIGKRREATIKTFGEEVISALQD